MKHYRPAVFIVTYRKERKKVFYLLLKRKLHWKGWEFPKGGIEAGEGLLRAAKRECWEECGQRPKKIAMFPYSGKYKYQKILSDRPGVKGQTWALFGAEVSGNKVKFDGREHSDYEWVDFKEAEKRLTWPNQKKCLKIVNGEITNKG